MKRRFSFLRRRLVTPALPKNADGQVLLHIGCGPVKSPAFINIDAAPYAHVHVVTDDISELADFATETVDLVYMCHVLEHIRRPMLPRVLREMHRVLKRDGVLRLAVPDFDALLDVYVKAGRDTDAIHNQLMGGQESKYNVHYSVFNRASLSRRLEEAGFRTIRPWDPDRCAYNDFKDKSMKVMTAGDAQIAVSLNLEAVK